LAECKKCKVQHFTRHDLRRTYSTGMARLGVPQHITELLLDHRSGTTMSAVAAIYNRYNYEAEMRDAVAKWEKHIGRPFLVSGASGHLDSDIARQR